MVILPISNCRKGTLVPFWQFKCTVEQGCKILHQTQKTDQITVTLSKTFLSYMQQPLVCPSVSRWCMSYKNNIIQIFMAVFLTVSGLPFCHKTETRKKATANKVAGTFVTVANRLIYRKDDDLIRWDEDDLHAGHFFLVAIATGHWAPRRQT